MRSRRSFKADGPRSHNFCAACRYPQRGPDKPLWTWVHDNFYITHTRAEPCGHADAESMNWPLTVSTWQLAVVLELQSSNGIEDVRRAESLH